MDVNDLIDMKGMGTWGKREWQCMHNGHYREKKQMSQK